MCPCNRKSKASKHQKTFPLPLQETHGKSALFRPPRQGSRSCMEHASCCPLSLTSVMAFLALSSAFLHSCTASSTSVCSWDRSDSIFFFWLMRLVFWRGGRRNMQRGAVHFTVLDLEGRNNYGRAPPWLQASARERGFSSTSEKGNVLPLHLPGSLKWGSVTLSRALLAF